MTTYGALVSGSGLRTFRGVVYVSGFCGHVMIRNVCVLLTILGLLACPVNCTGGKCVADDVVPARGCSGCSPSCPSSNEKSDPSQPGSEGPESNCHMGACRGVLAQSPRRPVVDQRLLLSLSSATLVPSGSHVDAVLERLEGHRSDLSRSGPASGRELCIELRSLLL